MTLHLNDAGTWRQAQGVYVNDSGTWREIQEVYVNDAGTWRSVFVNSVVTLASSYTPFGDIELDIQNTFSIRADGTLDHTFGASIVTDNWVAPAATASIYECRLSYVSGASTVTGSPTGAWLSMSSDRSWSCDPGANLVYTLEIRRASDATVVATSTINFSPA
jgi:hypothetical protein